MINRVDWFTWAKDNWNLKSVSIQNCVNTNKFDFVKELFHDMQFYLLATLDNFLLHPAHRYPADCQLLIGGAPGTSKGPARSDCNRESCMNKLNFKKNLTISKFSLHYRTSLVATAHSKKYRYYKNLTFQSGRIVSRYRTKKKYMGRGCLSCYQLDV